MNHRLTYTLSLLAGLAASVGADDETPAMKLLDTPRVLIVAHRGDSRVAPENTLPAFRSAVRAGADLVELDYQHSADGVPVVLHDKKLDRTTNAADVLGRRDEVVTNVPLDDLRKLDAGRWFDASFAGTRLPTLAESLEVIQAGSVTLIERKGGDAETCVQLLKEAKLLDRVVVQSFDWHYVAACRQLAPTLALAALGSDKLTPEKLDQAAKTGAQVIAWNHKHISRQEIHSIHARGLKAWVYTVNDEVRARELIADGIDGIITDLPAAMLRLVR